MTALSILIPTIKKHETLLGELLQELNRQIILHQVNVEILIEDTETESTGKKRNLLLKKAKGEYVAFFDADDKPSENYIKWLMEGIEKRVDCCSLKGSYSVDGIFDGIFEHSLKYDKWETVEGEIKYLRFPNHLNTIRSSIAKQFKFPDKSFGEDFDWSKLVNKSGLLKTEFYIPDVIYYYNYINK